MTVKPLFLPLNAEYFDAFLAGNKDTEYRLNGPRWNRKTCTSGRQILLSRGYGKQQRAMGTIHAAPVFELIQLNLPLQRSIRDLFRLSFYANPEIIAIEIEDIKRVYYEPRVFYGIDTAAGGDNTVMVTAKRRDDGSLEIINIKEKK